MQTCLSSELVRPTGLHALILIVIINCITAVAPTSIGIMDLYNGFVSEAEFSICLLCMFIGVDYFPWTVFGTIPLKTGRKSAKLSVSAETIAS